jgi:hypothetical protein
MFGQKVQVIDNVSLFCVCVRLTGNVHTLPSLIPSSCIRRVEAREGRPARQTSQGLWPDGHMGEHACVLMRRIVWLCRVCRCGVLCFLVCLVALTVLRECVVLCFAFRRHIVQPVCSLFRALSHRAFASPYRLATRGRGGRLRTLSVTMLSAIMCFLAAT